MSAIIDLHAAVSGGFASVDQRFAQIDRRFEQIDRRFASVEAEIAGLHRWTVRADERFDRIEGAIFS